MNKKENRMAVRQTVEKAVIRDEQNRRIQSAATNPVKEVLKILHTTLRGLEADTVSVNRSKYGTNKVTHEKKKSLAKRVAGAFINPFTAILFCLAFVSTITDMIFPYFSLFGSVPEDFDFLTVVIILTMVFISGTLRFVQESRSGNAAEKLLAMITTTCTVTRIGQEKTEIPMDDLVVGDIVHLSAGDMIPADVRILDAKDLFVSQASLTGESEPIEKLPHVSPHKDSVTDYTNIAFMGSNVISGSATAVVICVGDHTLFGSMAAAVAGEAVETSFTKGVNAVSWVLIRFMLVMVPLVFFVNGITKGDWLEAFLFGISIAVGLTPEMLPMIVTANLSKGALSMSKKKTIVKNLSKGMKQKVSMLLALVLSPKVLLVDEPMVGLDPASIEEVLKLLVELKNKGVAVLISTHIIDVIDDIWDKAYIMNKGKIVRTVRRDDLHEESLKEIFFACTGEQHEHHL